MTNPTPAQGLSEENAALFRRMFANDLPYTDREGMILPEAELNRLLNAAREEEQRHAEMKAVVASVTFERLSPPRPSPAAGEGWKLVPVEPTDEMLDASRRQAGESREMRERYFASMRRHWSRLLASAPTPPQEGQERVCPLCNKPSGGQCRGDADCPLACSRVPPEDHAPTADAARVIEPRTARRTHVPALESAAENQRPKDSNHHQTKLYRYEETDLHQWWSKRTIGLRRELSVFEEPFGEPFVIADAARVDASDTVQEAPRAGLREQFIETLLLHDGDLNTAQDGEDLAEKLLALIPFAAARSTRPVADAGEGWRPTHRHVKRGTEYQILGRAVVQTATPLEDEEYAIVYRDEGGTLWVRCADEFNDGRFQSLPAPPHDPQPASDKSLGLASEQTDPASGGGK